MVLHWLAPMASQLIFQNHFYIIYLDVYVVDLLYGGLALNGITTTQGFCGSIVKYSYPFLIFERFNKTPLGLYKLIVGASLVIMLTFHQFECTYHDFHKTMDAIFNGLIATHYLTNSLCF